MLTLLAVMVSIAATTTVFLLVVRDRRRSEARVAALAAALDAGGATAPARASELFGGAPGGSTPGALPLRIGIGAAAALVLVGVFFVATWDPTDSATAMAEPPPPLELVAMRHEREGRALIVTGDVRVTVPSLRSVTAELVALRADGSVAARAVAPLLGTPAGHHQFRSTITGVPDAVRYRVSFRTGTSVVRHVDRRQHAPAPAPAVARR